MLRRVLALVTNVAGALSAAMMVVMVAAVLFQIVSRMLGFRSFDAGELAGFLLAIMSFLALAYTFRAGGHIRVNVALSRLSGGSRRAMEIACLTVAAAIVLVLAWSSYSMARDSYEFGSVSTGMLAVPLWIPQVGMVVGAVLLLLVLVEGLVDTIQGRLPQYESSGHSTTTAE